jgi:hypothetical protein
VEIFAILQLKSGVGWVTISPFDPVTTGMVALGKNAVEGVAKGHGGLLPWRICISLFFPCLHGSFLVGNV